MSAFAAGLAEILEISEGEIKPELVLAAHNWDSLAVVSTIALIDEVFGRLVNGASLAACITVSDIEALAALEEVA
jgi:acyl carrier protein